MTAQLPSQNAKKMSRMSLALTITYAVWSGQPLKGRWAGLENKSSAICFKQLPLIDTTGGGGEAIILFWRKRFFGNLNDLFNFFLCLSTVCFLLVPPRKVLSMELVPQQKKWLSTLVPHKRVFNNCVLGGTSVPVLSHFSVGGDQFHT